MTDAPFDIVKFFDPDDEEDLRLVQVKIEDTWVDVPDTHNIMNATLLVVWHQRGVSEIAVEHEGRTVEFDLREVIVRDGSPLTTVERPRHE